VASRAKPTGGWLDTGNRVVVETSVSREQLSRAVCGDRGRGRLRDEFFVSEMSMTLVESLLQSTRS